MEKWAAYSGIKRAELTVMTHNEPAISLYKKMGFEIEGKKVCSLVVDGK
jgi:ribosomal protein S18 acetylase RimI-like enzyme